MKKTVIRIFALLLAAVMVLSLGVTAFAAELDLAEGRKGLDITDGNGELIAVALFTMQGVEYKANNLPQGYQNKAFKE